ncbi:MAG: HAD family phosphatase [Candidatus Woesearchaeota archaeon]|nr:MAG: HAD family phosphatase [Candidatus Woesearchaeota archaeon]
MIKAIIFDMDGVIINSEKVKAEAWKKVLSKYGVKDGDKWYKERAGISRTELANDAIKTFSLSAKVEDLYKNKINTYHKMLKNQTEPIESTIKFLKSIPKDIKIGLVSSQNKEIIKQQLKIIGVFSYFDVIISGDDTIDRNKPYPDAYLLAAKKLKIETDSCIAVEDTKAGVEAAKSAGMKCVGFKNLDSGNQDLSKADKIVSNLNNLEWKNMLD